MPFSGINSVQIDAFMLLKGVAGSALIIVQLSAPVLGEGGLRAGNITVHNCQRPIDLTLRRATVRKRHQPVEVSVMSDQRTFGVIDQHQGL
ncbi:hypothetical protein D3C85_1246320 [compost metagenome]